MMQEYSNRKIRNNAGTQVTLALIEGIPDYHDKTRGNQTKIINIVELI